MLRLLQTQGQQQRHPPIARQGQAARPQLPPPLRAAVKLQEQPVKVGAVPVHLAPRTRKGSHRLVLILHTAAAPRGINVCRARGL